jgi:radical SAM superfamily enzyme YgiQ (UPF0313 family)
MNVVLINPPWTSESSYGVRSNSRWPHTRKDKRLPFPLYLGYSAALLEKGGHRVSVIDAVAEDIHQPEELIKRIGGKADLAIIETSTPSINQDLECTKAIKDELDIGTAFVGTHSSYFHNEILRDHPFIDYILRGEYEYTALELSDNLGKDNRLSGILGLSYRNANDVMINDSRPLIEDLDALPFPARHLFDMSAYDTHLYHRPSFLMISSRGCPFQCIYCLWPSLMYGHRFRTRSPENIIEEILMLKKEYGAREIMFDDDTLTFSKEHVSGICNELLERDANIFWNCFGRVDTVSQEMLGLMSRSGCEMIRYGIESGSEELMRKSKRNTTLKQARDAIKWTKEAGMRTYGTFLIGLPGETNESIQKTIDFAKELDPYVVQFSIATPYPGTEYYEFVRERDLLNTNDWREFDGSCKAIIKTETLSSDELENAVARAWNEFYLRPSYIAKIIKSNIGSIEGIKMLMSGAKAFTDKFLFYRSSSKADEKDN